MEARYQNHYGEQIGQTEQKEDLRQYIWLIRKSGEKGDVYTKVNSEILIYAIRNNELERGQGPGDSLD